MYSSCSIWSVGCELCATFAYNLKLPLTGLAVALCLAFRRYGFDRHVWDSSIPTLVQGRKVIWPSCVYIYVQLLTVVQITMALEALYMISTSTTKISILLFYRRLTDGTISRGFMIIVYAAITFVALYFVIFFIILFLSCRPIYAFWQQVDITWEIQNKYHCINEEADLVAAAIVSVIQDFIACGLPTILFWKLRIPKRQKIALGAIFGVGFLYVCSKRVPESLTDNFHAVFVSAVYCV